MMKKLLLIMIVLGGGYYYFQSNEKNDFTVSEVINSSINQEIVNVTGIVNNNFKMFYGIYELRDTTTGESIMISTKGSLPKVGSTVTKQLKRNEVITLNDRTFSLFQEVE